MKSSINIKNKKASFQYEFIEKFTAGIVLTGTEIKSLRNGNASFIDAYCVFINKELWIKGVHISEYSYGTYLNHEPKRDRKLLLNKKELKKLTLKTREKGLTIVPIRLYINDKGFAKLQIALGKGKTTYDKRETLRRSDAKRDMDRMMKR